MGAGWVAGVFFAFSSFVMGALKRLEPEQGISAMQSINILAVTPVFMAALFGTAAACLGLSAWAVIYSDGRTTSLVLAGCVLYLVGTVGVTIARNVPLNERLAKLHPQSAEAAGLWSRYLTRWTAWNHVRTIAALAAAAALTVALHVWEARVESATDDPARSRVEGRTVVDGSIQRKSSEGGQDMAKVGDELINPVTKLRTVFRKTAQDTGGELLQVDWVGSPGWTTGPDHVHPLQEERFEVISGKLGLRVEGVERVLEEGEALTAPAGSAHAAWNAGDGEVHALIDFTGRPPGPRRPSRPWRVWRATGRPTGREPPREPVDAGPRPARVRGGDLLRPARRSSSRGSSSGRWPGSRGCSGTGPNTPNPYPGQSEPSRTAT